MLFIATGSRWIRILIPLPPAFLSVAQGLPADRTGPRTPLTRTGCDKSGVRSQESGVRSQGSGVRGHNAQRPSQHLSQMLLFFLGNAEPQLGACTEERGAFFKSLSCPQPNHKKRILHRFTISPLLLAPPFPQAGPQPGHLKNDQDTAFVSAQTKSLLQDQDLSLKTCNYRPLLDE